jgi:hypothetical protein
VAKLNYIPSFVGTRDGVCIYFMRGNFYMRSASSLTRRRVKTEKIFKKTREEATILGRASRLASVVYKAYEGKHKHYTLFRQLTGKAKAMINHGMSDEDIVYWLGQSL